MKVPEYTCEITSKPTIYCSRECEDALLESLTQSSQNLFDRAGMDTADLKILDAIVRGN